MLRKNEGHVDRGIRLVAAIVLIGGGLILFDGLQGSTVGLVVATLGLFPLVTGATGVCPLYVPFGITTLPARRDAAPRSSQGNAPLARRSREDALT